MTLGGSGHSAGLVVGDVVLEVNGQNVEDKHLEDVMMLVKKGGRSLTLLVMDEKSYKTKETEASSTDVTDKEVTKMTNDVLHTIDIYKFLSLSVTSIFAICSHLYLRRRMTVMS